MHLVHAVRVGVSASCAASAAAGGCAGDAQDAQGVRWPQAERLLPHAGALGDQNRYRMRAGQFAAVPPAVFMVVLPAGGNWFRIRGCSRSSVRNRRTWFRPRCPYRSLPAGRSRRGRRGSWRGGRPARSRRSGWQTREQS